MISMRFREKKREKERKRENKREKERKRKRTREKGRERERKGCPGSIIINLHLILKKTN